MEEVFLLLIITLMSLPLFLWGILFILKLKRVPTRPGNLIVINGLSQSGKTSVITSLMNNIGSKYQYVSVEEYVRKEIVSRKFHMGEDNRRVVVESRSSIFENVRKKLERGKNIIVDVNLIFSDIRHFLKSFKESNVFMVLLYCPLDELTRRTKKKTKSMEDAARSLRGMFKRTVKNKNVKLDTITIQEINEFFSQYSSPENDEIKQVTISHFGLLPNTRNSVDISTYVEYDMVINTKENSTKKCSRDIFDKLKVITPRKLFAFKKNCNKFLREKNNVHVLFSEREVEKSIVMTKFRDGNTSNVELVRVSKILCTLLAHRVSEYLEKEEIVLQTRDGRKVKGNYVKNELVVVRISNKKETVREEEILDSFVEYYGEKVREGVVCFDNGEITEAKIPKLNREQQIVVIGISVDNEENVKMIVDLVKENGGNEKRIVVSALHMTTEVIERLDRDFPGVHSFTP